jgi:hypothetical protein
MHTRSMVQKMVAVKLHKQLPLNEVKSFNVALPKHENRKHEHIINAIKCRKANVITSVRSTHKKSTRVNKQILTTRVAPLLCNMVVRGETKFVEAIILDLAAVGFNCNQKGTQNRTFLHYVSRFNCDDLLQILLSSNLQLDWNAEDSTGFTPIMHSCYNGNDPAVLKVLEHELSEHRVGNVTGLVALCVQLNRCDTLQYIFGLLIAHSTPDSTWRTEVQLAVPYLWKYGNAKMFNLLNETVTLVYQSKTKNERTALMECAMHGNHEVLALLMDTGACDLQAVCTDGCNALMYATMRKNSQRSEAYTEIVRLLLHRHTICGYDTSCIYSALIIAAKEQFWDAIDMLLEMNPDHVATRTFNWKAILNNSHFLKSLTAVQSTKERAAYVIPIPLIETMRDKGMDLDLLLDAYVLEGRLDALHVLLKHFSLCPTPRSMSMAIASRSIETVQLLLAHQAEINFDVGCSFSSSLVDRNLHLALAYRHGAKDMIRLVSSRLPALSNFVRLQNLHSALFAEHSSSDLSIGLRKQEMFGLPLSQCLAEVLTAVIVEFSAKDQVEYAKLGCESEIVTIASQDTYRTQLSADLPLLHHNESAYRLSQQIIESVVRVTDSFSCVESMFNLKWKPVRRLLVARVEHIYNGLPSCVLTTDTSNDHDESACIICMDAMDTQSNNVKLECRHRFHRACIVSWFKLKDTCPVCRCKA